MILVNNAALGTTEATRYKETDNLTQSELLTVWRTLNVEIDETVDTNGNHAGILSLAGIPTEQYRRACIELTEFVQDINKGNPDVIEIDNLSKVNDPLDPFDSLDIQNARSTPVASSDYWTVHLIAAFFEYDSNDVRQDQTYGWAAYNELDNTVFVYTTALSNSITNWNNNHNINQQADLLERTQVTITHEIGHLMSLSHTDKNVEQSVMSGNSDAWEDSQDDYQKFLFKEIKQIQAQTVPL